MGYWIFSFRMSYPIKTKIPSHLIKKLSTDGKLLLVLLLFPEGHVLEASLSHCGRGGVSLVFHLVDWGGCLAGILARDVLTEVVRIQHCCTFLLVCYGEWSWWSRCDRQVNTVLFCERFCKILRTVWFGVFWYDMRIESTY